MKRIVLLLCALHVIGTLCAQTIEHESSSPTLRKVDRAAERMKNKIIDSRTSIKPTGTIYYVSADGDDSNDGLSPQKAIRTIEKVNTLKLKPSDAVMFHRGDLWRGTIFTKPGVTYSAYGKGEKPCIYGSPYDTAHDGQWIATDVPNVYVYDRELPNDVGTIVFNHGEAGCAFKVIKMLKKGSPSRHIATREEFESYRDLKRDLDMYHDYLTTKRLYLCSTEGNPSERYESMEILPRVNIFRAADNVTIDNFNIKYCGAHAIGSGSNKGLTVTNCTLGWIGGSVQYEVPEGNACRFGNAIEIYGSCENFTIDNCYVYQVYDAALTHQHQGDVNELLTMKNVRYTNCLVEECVYGIEYFLGRANTIKEHYMLNILFKGNIIRRAGMGWGNQRPDSTTPAAIKSWSHHNNRAFNFVISHNIFDRSTYDLLNICYRDTYSSPKMEHNTYIQYNNADGGHIGQDRKFYRYDENFPDAMKRTFGDRNSNFIFIER